MGKIKVHCDSNFYKQIACLIQSFIFEMFRTHSVFTRTLVPLGDRVLVRRAAKKVKTESGIYLPEESVKAKNEGEVISVGDGFLDDNGKLHPMKLKVGDDILVPEYGGIKVNNESGEDLVLIRERDIVGKFVHN